jgi:predicted nucleic acid-binding protein
VASPLDPLDIPSVTRDPKDDYLVALAREAGADSLVSGDPDLTSLADPVLRVMTPRELLDLL